MRAKYLLSLLMVLFVFQGCAFLPKREIVSSTNEYNLAVEKAQNEMLLLNVVRASQRRPLYFTGFNLLRGNISSTLSTGLTIPFGHIGSGFSGAYSVAPSVSTSTNPSFDIGIFDTKEFIRGIMTPISMETLTYYWNERWPKEMLLYLLVDKIEFEGGTVITNYPEDSDAFRDFKRWAAKATSCEIKTQEKPQIGPDIKAKDLDLGKLLDIHKSGLTLVPVPGSDSYKLTPLKVDYYLQCAGEPKYIQFNKPHDGGAMGSGRLFLRSPEAIIYYLGEVLRSKVEKNFDTTVPICAHGPEALLFDVQPGEMDKSGRKPVVTVDYDGRTFVIPSEGAAQKDPCLVPRSMHTLSLLSELISLQKSAENLPTTGVVNVLGR